MSKYWRNDTKDKNHNEIVDELRKSGFEVIETERPVDILIYKNKWSGWIEIKFPSRSDTKIRRSQVIHMATTRMPVAFATTPQEAFEFGRTGIGLSNKQKDALAGLLVRSKAKNFTPRMIDDVLGI